MEFKQLEAFVAVVDYGSFSEAARRLYLTQPTISAHIRSLEDELHMKLIIRTTKKTTITAKGYQLYDSAVRMLEIRNNLLENFTGAHKHMIDLALVGQNTRDESCVFIPFCHDELVIATPVTDHYLALKNRETPAVFHDFLKDPIIFREKGSGTKKEMDLFLERTGITTDNLNVIARMNDLESIKKSIVNGLGISILSSRSVNDLLRTKQILVFPLEEAAHKRSFYIVYSKNRILNPHVKQFVQFVRDYYM